MILVCDGWRLGQQEPEGGLTDLQIFCQVPIFTFPLDIEGQTIWIVDALATENVSSCVRMKS